MSAFNTLAAPSLEIAKTYLYGRVVDAKDDYATFSSQLARGKTRPSQSIAAAAHRDASGTYRAMVNPSANPPGGPRSSWDQWPLEAASRPRQASDLRWAREWQTGPGPLSHEPQPGTRSTSAMTLARPRPDYRMRALASARKPSPVKRQANYSVPNSFPHREEFGHLS